MVGWPLDVSLQEIAESQFAGPSHGRSAFEMDSKSSGDIGPAGALTGSAAAEEFLHLTQRKVTTVMPSRNSDWVLVGITQSPHISVGHDRLP